MTEREIGGVTVGRPVRVGGTQVGAPADSGSQVGRPLLVPGAGARRIAELVDVELVDGPEPTVLVRDPETEIFHSQPLSQIRTESRGSTVWYVEQPPPHVLPEEWRLGDWVTVIAGDERGNVYLITEE